MVRLRLKRATRVILQMSDGGPPKSPKRQEPRHLPSLPPPSPPDQFFLHSDPRARALARQARGVAVIALFLVSAEQRRSHVSSVGSLWAPCPSATIRDRCAGLDFTRCVNQFFDVRIGKRSGVCAAASRKLGPAWASASLGKDKSRSTKSSKPEPVPVD
jgi:hypothetical protein